MEKSNGFFVLQNGKGEIMLKERYVDEDIWKCVFRVDDKRKSKKKEEFFCIVVINRNLFIMTSWKF